MIKLDYNPTTFEAETRLSQILDQPEIHSETLPLKKKKSGSSIYKEEAFEMI